MSEGVRQLVAGRYRLESRIGSGAMGVVWRAVDERLDRPVAVKQLLLPPGLNEVETEKARQRAFREGRIAARLQHPHAITVFTVADHDGRPVLVMEYLPSRSLADVLDERGTLPSPDVARIGAQVAGALTAAHAAGVVHRDVKPGNILLGEDGTAKITDFGISRAAGDITVTSTGLLAGTPAFLAPEVARGAEPGSASDVFSLGATLYAAVEGRPPFETPGNEIALLHAVAAGQVTPPRQAGPLTAQLLWMLRAEPGARPTMAQVESDLTALADGHGGTAPAMSVGEPPTVPGAPPVNPAAGRPRVTRLDLRPADSVVMPSGAPAPAPTGTVSARPAPPAPGSGRGSSRIRLTAAVLAVLAAAAAGVLIAELLMTMSRPPEGPGETRTTVTNMVRKGPPASGESAPAPVTTEETEGRTENEAADVADVTTGDLEEAVADYYAALPENTDEGWNRLGPRLREQGREQYDRFWGTIEEVTVVGQPRALGDGVVEVALEFTVKHRGVVREVHQLGMLVTGGSILVDTDELISSVQAEHDGAHDEAHNDDN